VLTSLGTKKYDIETRQAAIKASAFAKIKARLVVWQIVSPNADAHIHGCQLGGDIGFGGSAC
jgi:hypothetical protein